MTSVKAFINTAVSVVLTDLVFILGGLDIALKALLIFMAIDYISGILKAGYQKALNSTIGLKGLIKKVGLLCLVAVAVVIDNVAGETGAIRTLVIYYLVANEGLSVLENLAALDIKIPKIIVDKLAQLQDHNTETPAAPEEPEKEDKKND